VSDEPIKAAFLKWCDEHAAFMRANGENIAASAARSMMDFEAGYRAAIRARVAELELSARIDAVTIEELRAERETMSAAIDRLACIADGFRAERDSLAAHRTVVMPLDGSVVPERMALFSRPALTIQASHDEMDSEVLEQFTRWLCIEMPQGTLIGSPSWWAPKIMRAISAIRAELGGQRE
jgi:hypothetical protein